MRKTENTNVVQSFICCSVLLFIYLLIYLFIYYENHTDTEFYFRRIARSIFSYQVFTNFSRVRKFSLDFLKRYIAIQTVRITHGMEDSTLLYSDLNANEFSLVFVIALF